MVKMMLTRDGERVLEILLIAAGLALAVAFEGDLPRAGWNAGASVDDAAAAMAVDRADRDQRRHLPASIDGKHAHVATLERMLTDAAARLADQDVRKTRC